MYVVGFVDNSFDMFSDYEKRLKRYDIELLATKAHMTMEQIVDWILENDIKCLMVDYRLRPDFDFAGTDLVAYINGELPDLPCMILTAHSSESADENLVVCNMIEERGKLDASDNSEFIAKLKQATKVFDNRLARHEDEYIKLLAKRNGEEMTAMEEERFLDLYKLLRAYGKVDDIPSQLASSAVGKTMDALLEKLDAIISANSQ